MYLRVVIIIVVVSILAQVHQSLVLVVSEIRVTKHVGKYFLLLFKGVFWIHMSINADPDPDPGFYRTGNADPDPDSGFWTLKTKIN